MFLRSLVLQQLHEIRLSFHLFCNHLCLIIVLGCCIYKYFDILFLVLLLFQSLKMLNVLIYLGRISRYYHMLLELYVLILVLNSLHLMFVLLGLRNFLEVQIHHQIYHLYSYLLLHQYYYILYSVDIFFVLQLIIYL